ncbi:hypothetical protein BV22DRAFT_1048590 [Leucogyrophana mollusca]|uniref:Uncharacterized protein n=1 Tax=Leucogyrophana mollusca TaxID=85980 RepID=A0ACB8BDG4_9AGAM|nr:hypothetical protein BV22DRAFT_1048590 [Leucogyrophana mollusca]
MNPLIHSPASSAGHSPDTLYKSTDVPYSKHGMSYSPSHYSSKSPWSSYARHASGYNSVPHFVPSINPRVTILPQQASNSSDLDTPSSSSSYSLLTPSSPFPQPVVEDEDMDMDMEDFEYDDDEDVDSEFAEEMDCVDDVEIAEHSPPYSMAVPHIIKSTSALEGALGNYSRGEGLTRGALQSSQYGWSDRKMSASAPGHPNSSQRAFDVHAHHRHDSDEPASFPHASHHPPSSLYPHHNTIYTHSNSNSSTTLFAPTPSFSLQASSSSLAGAIPHGTTSCATRSSSGRLPIHQPQPIRPIPPIPLSDLASSAAEEENPAVFRDTKRVVQQSQGLSPLSLLCQPVSDAIRYQLKTTSTDNEDQYYDEEGAEGTSRDATEGDTRFIQEKPVYFPDGSATGSCTMESHVCSCGCMGVGLGY